jgi:hypothetical protein
MRFGCRVTFSLADLLVRGSSWDHIVRFCMGCAESVVEIYALTVTAFGISGAVFRCALFRSSRSRGRATGLRGEGVGVVRTWYPRLISGLVVSAVMGALLPQMAYAAPASGGGDGRSVIDTVKDWFSDDGEAKPPGDPKLGIASREKLPKGRKDPKAKRVRELTGRRKANARFWKLSDGRVQTELSAAPTSYKSGKSWKSIDTTVRETRVKGFDFANTTNSGRSFFGSDPKKLLRFAVSGRRPRATR